MSCHPKLIPTIHTDKRHRPMLTCIRCHAGNIGKMSECGADCFACHSIQKIEKSHVKEHRVVRQCRKCHIRLQENLQVPKTGETSNPNLKTFLSL